MTLRRGLTSWYFEKLSAECAMKTHYLRSEVIHIDSELLVFVCATQITPDGV